MLNRIFKMCNERRQSATVLFRMMSATSSTPSSSIAERFEISVVDYNEIRHCEEIQNAIKTGLFLIFIYISTAWAQLSEPSYKDKSVRVC